MNTLRVFAVWTDETGEPVLPVACFAADTTCVLSSIEILWTAFYWVCTVLLLESKKHGKPVGWAGWISLWKARGLINDTPLRRVSQTCCMMCFIRKTWMWIAKQRCIPWGCEGNREMFVAKLEIFFQGQSMKCALLLFRLHVSSRWHFIVNSLVCVYVWE